MSKIEDLAKIFIKEHDLQPNKFGVYLVSDISNNQINLSVFLQEFALVYGKELLEKAAENASEHLNDDYSHPENVFKSILNTTL